MSSESVPAGPHTLSDRVREVVLELPSHKGIPALAGLLRVRETGSAGKTSNVTYEVS